MIVLISFNPLTKINTSPRSFTSFLTPFSEFYPYSDRFLLEFGDTARDPTLRSQNTIRSRVLRAVRVFASLRFPPTDNNELLRFNQNHNELVTGYVRPGT